jgi:hypothetical protein
MMKKIIWLIPLLILFGCASTQRVADLEDKIAQMSKQKATGTMLLAEQAGARKFWWRNALIGGGSALDGIPNSTLVDGDAAFVMVLEGTGPGSVVTGYLFVYVDDDDTAETMPGSPLVIEPNDGGGAWRLVNWNAALMTSSAAAGTHFIEATNAGDLAAGSRAAGRCWYDTTNDLFKCIDNDGSTPNTIGP